MTPEGWTHKHGSSQTAPYRVLSGECVVVVVGNYLVCRLFYEVICTSACTSGFATHVESRSPPSTLAQCKAEFRGFKGTRASTSVPSSKIRSRTHQTWIGIDRSAGLPPYLQPGWDPRGDRPVRHRPFSTLARSICQSRSFSVARLSCCFLPRARPTESLARPLVQWRSSGTSA